MRFAILGTTWTCTRSLCVAITGRSSLAREGVVHRLTASTDPTSCHPALVGQSAAAAPLQFLTPRRPRFELSCVVTLKRHFRKSGFSGMAAGVLSGCLRESSSRLYQSRVADLWLVSWKGCCSSQRHCSSSRGLSDILTPGQGLVRLCG